MPKINELSETEKLSKKKLRKISAEIKKYNKELGNHRFESVSEAAHRFIIQGQITLQKALDIHGKLVQAIDLLPAEEKINFVFMASNILKILNHNILLYNLPDEIKYLINSHLDYAQQLNLRQVNKDWHRIVSFPQSEKDLIARYCFGLRTLRENVSIEHFIKVITDLNSLGAIQETLYERQDRAVIYDIETITSRYYRWINPRLIPYLPLSDKRRREPVLTVIFVIVAAILALGITLGVFLFNQFNKIPGFSSLDTYLQLVIRLLTLFATGPSIAAPFIICALACGISLYRAENRPMTISMIEEIDKKLQRTIFEIEKSELLSDKQFRKTLKWMILLNLHLLEAQSADISIDFDENAILETFRTHLNQCAEILSATNEARNANHQADMMIESDDDRQQLILNEDVVVSIGEDGIEQRLAQSLAEMPLANSNIHRFFQQAIQRQQVPSPMEDNKLSSTNHHRYNTL